MTIAACIFILDKEHTPLTLQDEPPTNILLHNADPGTPELLRLVLPKGTINTKTILAEACEARAQNKRDQEKDEQNQQQKSSSKRPKTAKKIPNQKNRAKEQVGKKKQRAEKQSRRTQDRNRHCKSPCSFLIVFFIQLQMQISFSLQEKHLSEATGRSVILVD